jgi:hypothetical protein
MLRVTASAISRLFNSAGSWRHNKVTTTLTVYVHLINTDDHTGNMAALGALSAPAQKVYGGNVIQLHG